MFKGLQQNGIFIAFEGTDGCGKTTTLKLVEDYLKKASVPLVITREPAGTPLGAKIRKQLLDPKSHLDKNAQAELFLEARYDHLNHVVLPALRDKKVILCDRYVLSNLAYQGDYQNNPYYLEPSRREETLAKYGKSKAWAEEHKCDVPLIDKNRILAKNLALPNYITPNLNVYLQADPKTDIQRLNNRAEKSDKFDQALHNLKNLRHLQTQYRYGLMDMDTPHLLVNADDNPKVRAKFIVHVIMELANDADTPEVYPFTPY